MLRFSVSVIVITTASRSSTRHTVGTTFQLAIEHFTQRSVSSGLLLWQAERNHLPIFFRRYPFRCLFSEAARYEEFNDLRHKSPYL
jgi:hypothetical protein